jgi:hypothetical protein
LVASALLALRVGVIVATMINALDGRRVSALSIVLAGVAVPRSRRGSSTRRAGVPLEALYGIAGDVRRKRSRPTSTTATVAMPIRKDMNWTSWQSVVGRAKLAECGWPNLVGGTSAISAVCRRRSRFGKT